MLFQGLQSAGCVLTAALRVTDNANLVAIFTLMFGKIADMAKQSAHRFAEAVNNFHINLNYLEKTLMNFQSVSGKNREVRPNSGFLDFAINIARDSEAIFASARRISTG